MNRRDLIRDIAAGTVTLLFVPALVSSCKKEDVLPEDNNGNNPVNKLTINLDEKNLWEAGAWVVVENVIIINNGSEFFALSSVCTHQGCQVGYAPASETLPCPCHGSVFNTSGAVVNGPASSPLKKYEVSQEGSELVIYL